MPETVLLAAGGTGGHVFPGLATARALHRMRPDLEIAFVGTADRLEAKLVPEHGWTLHTVPALPLNRRSLKTLTIPFVMLGAVRTVRRLIKNSDVIAAVCYGGYTSVPLALAARSTKTPLVVHEQNAVVGKANKLTTRFADAVALTYEEAAAQVDAPRVEVTGNPVRPGMLPEGAGAEQREALRGEAFAYFDLDPGRRTLFVFGGSQGALRINNAATSSAGLWAHPEDIQILHAAGARTYKETAAAWEAQDQQGLLVRCVEFVDRMDLAYAAADLAVCRGGASSLAELTAFGVPATLVPYPYHDDMHQLANGRAVERAGGALVVLDEALDGASLVAAAEPVLTDPEQQARMAKACAAFGRPDAADALAALVLETAKR